MNGTGKSSLLKALAGVQKIFSGSIEQNTKHIAYIPQNLSLDPDIPLRVGEFFALFHKSVCQNSLEKYMTQFQIAHLTEQNIHTLSGGEFQKVLLVNAVLHTPDLLLLDEPTSGIDVIGEEVFYQNISELKEIFPHIAVVLVSHNIHLVYKNSDRVICLHKNNFCCHGTPAELKNNSDIQDIFGDYVRPYEHHPHPKHTH